MTMTTTMTLEITEVKAEIAKLESKGSTGRRLQRLQNRLYTLENLAKLAPDEPTSEDEANASYDSDDTLTPVSDPIDGAAILAACGMAAPTATMEDVIEIPQDTEDAPTVSAPVKAPNKRDRRKAKQAEEAKATAPAPKTSPGVPVRNAKPKATATPAPAPKEKATNGREKKDGLRKPQIKVLEVLNKAGRPLTRKEIADAGKLDAGALSGYIGANNSEVRAKDDAAKFVSLLTLKFVKHEVHDEDGKNVNRYAISAAGKTALAKEAK